MTQLDSGSRITEDERYAAAVRELQSGSVARAVETFTALLDEFPTERATLEPLLQQASMKASLEQQQISAKSFWHMPFSRNTMRLLLVGIMVSIVTFGLVAFYQTMIVPRRSEAMSLSEQTRLLNEARNSLATGQYERARNTFAALVALAPDSAQAEAGLRTAERQLELANLYAEATALQRSGQLSEALEIFQRIHTAEPLYRDVADHIRRLTRQDSVDELFEELQEAYTNKDWERVIRVGETIRTIDGRFQAAVISDYLFQGYMAQGGKLQFRAPDIHGATRSSSADQALEMFQNALRENPRHPGATTARNQMLDYIRGRDAYQQGNFALAANYWLPLYQAAPDMLGGQLGNDLFDTLMQAGARAESEEDLLTAYEYYSQAAQLDMPEAHEARLKAQALVIQLTPTPTPTPTMTPTPDPGPPPPPTPTPTPGPVWWYPEWIAFKTDRNGWEQIYVMRPDGTGARPVSDNGAYEEVKELQRLAPSSGNRVYVEGHQRGQTNIYVFREDWPEHWDRRELIFGNGSLNYDPVWSPNSEWIAFVSQVTGGDEIWVVRSDGSGEARRLTWNTWEWDKHPSWSPDGTQIVFWSNREVGHKQIWIMDADGKNQRNISQNEFNDWDPIWLPEKFDR